MYLTAAVIDSDPLSRTLIIARLAAMGHRGLVCVAKTFNAIERLVDIVFVDLLNPEKEGIEVIMEIRARHPSLLIMAMSRGTRSVPASTLLGFAVDLGANFALIKPLAPIAVDAILTHVFELRCRADPVNEDWKRLPDEPIPLNIRATA